MPINLVFMSTPSDKFPCAAVQYFTLYSAFKLLLARSFTLPVVAFRLLGFSFDALSVILEFHARCLEFDNFRVSFNCSNDTLYSFHCLLPTAVLPTTLLISDWLTAWARRLLIKSIAGLTIETKEQSRRPNSTQAANYTIARVFRVVRPWGMLHTRA